MCRGLKGTTVKMNKYGTNVYLKKRGQTQKKINSEKI